MSFSTAQIRKLQQPIKPDCVRTREVNGRQMSYIEGWHAIAEANRIFGFDGWNRETVENRCVLSRESKGTFHTVYIAKVRIAVRTPDITIIREGFGTGDAQASSAGEAHDKAIKTAETDATKRALATFGKPFGLSLYLSTRLRDTKPTPPIERRRTLQRLGTNGRYYVPPRPQPVLDPELSSATGQPATTEPEHALLPAPALSAPEVSLPIPPIIEKVPSADTSRGQMLIAHPTRRRDANHLRFVAGQPCLVCSRTPSDAHHLKFAQPTALAKKVSDEFTVPLCRIHHRQLHQGGNEVNWWMDLDIDPLPIARQLWEESHTTQPAAQTIAGKPRGQ
jgi:DNA recombination protein Rad52